MKYRFIISLLLVFLSTLIKAQQEYTLHFDRQLVQSMNTNPALKNDAKFILMLPSVVFNYGNNAFSYNDLVKDHSVYDSTYLDIDGVLDQMSDNNILQLQSDMEILGAYYNYKEWFFTFTLSEKFDVKINYPKELIDLLWNGNAKFIGKNIEIGPGININYYKELGFGLGRHYDKWDLGVKMKLLSGMANIYTISDNLSLYTAPDDFDMTLSTNYEIKTSGTDNPLQYLLQPPQNFENPGLGFDLGVVYRVNDKLQLSQSILELGAIKWKRGVVTYKSNGSFTYSGVDLSEFINDDEVYFDEFRDSIKNLYFDETHGGSYVNYLVPETYTSAFYEPGNKVSLGALIHLTYFKGVQFGASLYAGKEFTKYLQFGLSYSIKNRRYDNIGMNINLGPKGFKLFVVTDNLMNFLSSKRGRNVTWRYGINIAVGEANNSHKKSKKYEGEPEVLDATEE